MLARTARRRSMAAMLIFALTVIITLGVSFCCSLMEACAISTTVTDIEALKRNHARAGEIWEKLKRDIDSTISAILTLNTIANTVGSMGVGAQAALLLGDFWFGVMSACLTLAILIFAEVLPKSLAVVHRKALLPILGFPILWLCISLKPIAWFCAAIVRLFVPEPPLAHTSEQEIMLLAERGAKDGSLSRSESSIIANALSLDDVRVAQTMTPRSVVTAVSRNWSVGEITRRYPNLPFARMPVYDGKLDNIVGLVRRRDILKAKANDQDTELIGNLMHEVQFIPKTVTLSHALQLFLKTQQQLAVAVDEYGAVAGVITMEDVIEHILGREIFEKDDPAVDMRELARTHHLNRSIGAKKNPGTKPA